MGSSTFSEGRSSIGIKSSASLANSSSGRIASFSLGGAGISSFFTFFGAGFAGAATSFFVSSATVAGCASGCSAVFFTAGLRPLFLGALSSAFSSAAFSAFGAVAGAAS